MPDAAHDALFTVTPLQVTVRRVPPHVYFVVSAVFHYLGPAFAVLLFAQVAPLGVAWLRIATAAAVFALWRRPWRFFRGLTPGERWIVVSLGGVLAVMNSTFYLALDRLPLGTVGAIEFLGPIGLVALAQRTVRNWVAFALAVAGVYGLTDVRIVGAPLGYLFAFANCGLFVLYVMLGHRIAKNDGTAGIDRLALSMLIAMVVALPIGFAQAAPAFRLARPSRGRYRRGYLLVRHTIRLRSTRHGADAAGDIRAHAGAAPSHGNDHRRDRPGPDSIDPGDARGWPGHRGRCDTPGRNLKRAATGSAHAI